MGLKTRHSDRLEEIQTLADSLLGTGHVEKEAGLYGPVVTIAAQNENLVAKYLGLGTYNNLMVWMQRARFKPFMSKLWDFAILPRKASSDKYTQLQKGPTLP